ncbi:hypothetical protein BTO30_11690 [Domibacillus antri]|uniref:MurNAc-LAA domain-containing protein n=1 Tax=Domibacillus antri TaxID=1714264 RepID=A0A1Q8Q3R5_9BACI|nr:N-acetylmuramoyl-L-alanine amidase [Domibacillus antri]OLN21989.1 hypothetical protein BTO30_11690 [Domibacillus antri]
MSIKGIELHPGHWKNPGSGASSIINEVTEARRVTKRVYDILKAYKVPAAYFEDNTSSNQAQNLNTLVKHHNQDRDDLIVSVHFNASKGVTDSDIGTEVLYYNQETLAAKIAKAISDASGLKDRGAKQRTGLAVLSKTYEPAVLIEVCFVNSRSDVDKYRKHFEKICFAIAQTLAAHVGYTIKAAGSTSSTSTAPKKEEPTLASELYQPSNTAIKNSTRTVLNRLVQKDPGGIDPSWIKKLDEGTLTESDALGLIFVAIERGLIQGQKE